MLKFVLSAVVLFFATMLSGCGGNTDSVPVTGFRGIVQEKLKSGETVLFPNATVVVAEYGVFGDEVGAIREVARTTTDAEGRYFVSLPPGSYAISGVLEQPYSDGCSLPFAVEENLQEGQLIYVEIIQINCR